MRSLRVAVIPGDGIGPEVVAAAVRVLSATGIQFEWETETAGAASPAVSVRSPGLAARETLQR